MSQENHSKYNRYVLRFHRLDHDVQELMGMLNLPRSRPPHTNRGADKWYSAQYKAVLELVKDSKKKEMKSSEDSTRLTIRMDL